MIIIVEILQYQVLGGLFKSFIQTNRPNIGAILENLKMEHIYIKNILWSVQCDCRQRRKI